MVKPEIYIILKPSKNGRVNDYQQLIIDFFLDVNDIQKINILPIDLFFDDKISMIDLNNDYVFIDKDFAYNNIDVVKSFQNCAVLLENETVYLRKINKLNPINENLALNHNFKILYLTNNRESTNDEYKIIVDNMNYLFNFDKFFKTIKINNSI